MTTLWLPVFLFFAASVFLWVMNGLDELEEIAHAHRLRRMKS